MRATLLAATVAVLVCAAPARAQVSTGDNPTSDGIEPAATTQPSVNGTERDGSTLTGDDGDWGPLVNTEHIWLRCNTGGTDCSHVSDAASYGLTAPDVDAKLRFRVRATGALGFTETDTVTGVIQPITTDNVTPPQITGTVRQGELLSVTQGTWNGTTPLTYTYRWERCDGACTEVATSALYGVAAADVGKRLKVTVTATGPGGTDAASSPLSGIVATTPATGGSGGVGGGGVGSGGGGGGTGTTPGRTTLRKLSPFPVVAIGGRVRGLGAFVSQLRVSRAPRGATVTVTCKGRDCPFRRTSRKIRRRSGLRIKSLEKGLRRGTVIVIVIRKGKTIGKYTRLRIREGAPPARIDSCIRPGARGPSACPG